MKFTTSAALTLAGVAAASPVAVPQPFELVLSSTDKSVDGRKIGTCHSGAAIEATCIQDNGSTFYLNTTEGAQAPVPNWTAPGTVTYNLPVNGGNETEPLSLQLTGDYATNVQEALFQPADYGVGITFNADTQNAGIISYLNDTVDPPNGTVPKVYTNWWACDTYYLAYTYQTLSWVPGNGSQKPQNPSCIKVDVVRNFLN